MFPDHCIRINVFLPYYIVNELDPSALMQHRPRKDRTTIPVGYPLKIQGELVVVRNRIYIAGTLLIFNDSLVVLVKVPITAD